MKNLIFPTITKQKKERDAYAKEYRNKHMKMRKM
jgi:hypothetical protein